MEQDQGVRLKRVVDELRLSVNKFSELLGYSRPEKLYRIITGKNKISYQVLTDILKSFPNVNGDYLMFGKGEPFINPHVYAGDKIKKVANKFRMNSHELGEIVGTDYEREIFEVLTKNATPSHELLNVFDEKFLQKENKESQKSDTAVSIVIKIYGDVTNTLEFSIKKEDIEKFTKIVTTFKI